MVLVEEVNDNNGSSSSNNNQQNSQESGRPDSRPSASPQSNFTQLTDFILQDKISFVLWLTRIFSILCSFAFIIPIFGYDQNTLFQKAIMSSAATSALKLHQRIATVPFQFSREYLAKLLIEDSFHYLLYSFIFLNTSPITIVLIPIIAFALLHVSVYTLKMLNLLSGPQSFGPIRKGMNLIISRDKDLMRFVAVNEIILAPTIIVMILTGKCGIFVPFIYYRFVCMRYQSRRNPYNRIMFYEMRMAVENYSNQPSCPQAVRNLSQRLISLVSRFAPPQI